jgi:hypothetical protein
MLKAESLQILSSSSSGLLGDPPLVIPRLDRGIQKIFPFERFQPLALSLEL